MGFINEKCQCLLEEYDQFYCTLAETLDGIAGNRRLKLRFEELFLEIGGDGIYERIINGDDFEVIFRNVLSSSLVKLSQLLTELIDKRYTEIREKKIAVQCFMNQYLEVEDLEGPINRRPTATRHEDFREDDEKVYLEAFNSNLYESI